MFDGASDIWLPRRRANAAGEIAGGRGVERFVLIIAVVELRRVDQREVGANVRRHSLSIFEERHEHLDVHAKRLSDRFKKATNILDLMMEKLPLKACPFTVQMGEETARLYLNIGKASNDSTLIAKSNKMLEDEIMRYGQYIRYYQSLSPSQYDRLTNIDKFIDQQYLLNLLGDYGAQVSDEQYQAIAGKLQASGVNIERQQAYQDAYERAMQERMQAARESAE
jgi:hypothetical protein